MNLPLMQPSSPQWKIYDDRKEPAPVCDFVPTVLECQQVLTPSGELSKTLIRLSLEFSDGTNGESIVNLSELDRLNWSNLDRRCIVNSSNRNSKRYIANFVQNGLKKAPVKTIYSFDRTGIFHINNSTLFVAGDRVITRSSVTEDNLSFCPQTPFRLDIDEDLEAEDAVKGMKELMSLSPEIGRVLVAHVISGIIRVAFKKVGFTPRTVLAIMGESGMLKSSYVPHLVQLYNRLDGIEPATRFNSTKSFIEERLYDYSECTAVIDDLHTAGSRSIKRQNEDTAEEIVRRISDDIGRGRMEGHTQVQQHFPGNVVFIGEYIVGKASSIPRVLVVKLTCPPNGEIFDDYQRHRRLVVSTFYSYFIQWYVDHFDEICTDIDSRLTKFRKDAANSNVHGRLRDARFYLLVSYMFFLKFCEDAGCYSTQDKMNDYNDFNSYLVGLIREQQARFVQDNNSRTIDYLYLIRNLYYSGAFRIAKDEKDFNPTKHDGLFYYGCLCLRGESLGQMLAQMVPHFDFKDCIKSLRAINALKVGQKSSIQVNGTGGIRFYAIWLQKLQ